MDEHQISKNISDHFDKQFSSLLNYVSKKQGIAKGDWKYIPSNNRRRLLTIAQNKTLYDAHHRYPGVPMDTIKKIILHRSNTISHTTIEEITPDYYQTEVRPVINISSVPEDIGDFGRRYRREDPRHISRFHKHVGSKNEWFVVTDKNMNVLSAHDTGYTDKVPIPIKEKAYSEVRERLPEGYQQDVYTFHSHPPVHGINVHYPSQTDLKGVVHPDNTSGEGNRNLNIIGDGIMTRKGINVMRVENPTRRSHNLPNYYENQRFKHNLTEASIRGVTRDNTEYLPRETRRALKAGASKAFFDTQKKYPELQTRFIKREIIRPSDARPHITTRGSRDRRPVISIDGEAYQVGRDPEDIGDFGKKKRQKTIIKKDRTVFYGI
jgi:hypothetical protein